MSKTPGDRIIEEVSMPLAKTVLQTDFESETGEALRSKTLELLLALDVIASATHDIKHVSERSVEFKQQFEDNFQTDFMKQDVYDDFANNTTVSSTETVTKGGPGNGPILSKAKRVTGVSRVEKGVVTEVTVINPDTRSGNMHEAPFLADSHAAELEKQNTFRNDSLNAIRDNVRNPLNQITTIHRMGSKGANPDTSLSKSFMMDPSFRGVLTDSDKATIGKFVDKNNITVQTSEKTDSDYLKTLTEKSNANQSKREIAEEKRSDEIETTPSKDSAPQTTPASTPSVMVTGGGGSYGGGASFGGGAFGRTGGARQTATFGKNRRNSDDIKTSLENSKIDDEIDIDKLVSEMLNENKTSQEATLESTTSKLPENSYTVVNGPDGKPLGYKVSKELGGGVFLFDPETGKSTPLTMTNKDNVFMHPETGQYYQMDFPESDSDTSSSETSTEEKSDESATLSPIESDAEPVKKEVDFSEINQDLLDSQGLSKINIDGEYYYASFDKEGNIDTLIDTSGNIVDNTLREDPVELPLEYADGGNKNSENKDLDMPPSLSELFDA